MANKNTNFERDCENFIEDIAKSLFVIIQKFLKEIFYGIKKLKTKKYIFVFITSLVITECTYLLKDKILQLPIPVNAAKVLFLGLLFSPLFVLVYLGSLSEKNKEKFKKAFDEIGFKGKDGSVPFFIDQKENGKKKILLFKSVIPLNDWKNYKERLETGLDCNILSIQNGKSKRIIKMVTVSSEYRIPDYLRWNDSYIDPDEGVVIVGISLLEPITFNLNSTAHVLIAGETGSGKSVILRCCLWQMAYKGAKIYMFDFKGGIEFNSDFEKFGAVITDRKKAIALLDEILVENQLRMEELKRTNVKNIVEYNKKATTKMCRICMFCDEVAEMMDKRGAGKVDKELIEQISGKVSTITRLCRATGINVFLGVQRPDANVITGQIKSNLPVRICGRFADRPPSEIVLDNAAACELPDIKGRFLFKSGYEVMEFQSFFFKDGEDLKDTYTQKGVMLTEMYRGSYDDGRPTIQEEAFSNVTAVEKNERWGRRKEENAEMNIDDSMAADDLLKQMNTDYADFDDEELPF